MLIHHWGVSNKLIPVATDRPAQEVLLWTDCWHWTLHHHTPHQSARICLGREPFCDACERSKLARGSVKSCESVAAVVRRAHIGRLSLQIRHSTNRPSGSKCSTSGSFPTEADQRSAVLGAMPDRFDGHSITICGRLKTVFMVKDSLDRPRHVSPLLCRKHAYVLPLEMGRWSKRQKQS